MDHISNTKKRIPVTQKKDDRLAEMNAYSQIMTINCSSGKYNEAVVNGKKWLVIAQEVVNKLEESSAYLMLAKTYRDLDQKDNAVLHSKKCIETANQAGDQNNEMTACFVLGKLYCASKQYKDAIAPCERGLTIAKEIVDKKYQAMLYLLLQDCYHHVQLYADAIRTGKKCITVVKEIGDVDGEVAAYQLLITTYTSLGKFDKAIFYTEKSIAFVKQAGDKHAEMDILFKLGTLYRSALDEKKALFYFRKSIQIGEEFGFHGHEADYYLSLGKELQSQKEYHEAIDSYKKCLVAAWRTGNKHMEMDAFCQIGNAYEYLNQFDEALRFGKKAMNLARELGDEEDVLEAHLALGIAHLGLDHHTDALYHLQEGMKIAEKLKLQDKIEAFQHFLTSLHQRLGFAKKFCTDHTENSCSVYNYSVGNHTSQPFYKKFSQYRSEENYEQAIVYLRKHMEVEGCNGDLTCTKNKMLCFGELAKMHATLKQYEKSLKCYQEGLAISERVGSKHMQAEFYFGQGKLYRIHLQKMNEAEQSFRKSVQCFEVMFEGLSDNDDFKISILDVYIHNYSYLVEVLIATGQLRKALLASERCRARALKDLLAAKYGMEPDENKHQDLQFMDVKSVVSGGKYTIIFFSQCCKAARTLYRFVISNMNQNLLFSCSCIHHCGPHGDMTFNDIIDKAYDEMHVLEDANCENRSFENAQYAGRSSKLAIKKDELNPLLQNLQIDKMSKQCRGVPQDKKTENPPRNTEVSSTYSALEEIYQRTLGKLYIKQDELVIIPDGSLSKVPFAALRDPDTGRYLSETKRIRLAPSISTLYMLQQLPENSSCQTGALIIGDPSVGKVMLDGKEHEFEILEGAREEACDIALILWISPLIGPMATKPEVLKRLQQGVSVIHIAAHGDAIKATIALAPSPEIRKAKIPDEEDYLLTMADVQKAQVRAQLVVLSCCHSGRGEIRAEGVVGMCRAFLASGARAVLASLWSIYDEATLEFMNFFYTHLKEGKSASTSLQLTTDDMRKSKRFSEPQYWAPFFLMGDDVTIKID